MDFFSFHLINLKRLLWDPGLILVHYSNNQSLNFPGAEGVHTITRGYSWVLDKGRGRNEADLLSWGPNFYHAKVLIAVTTCGNSLPEK